MATFVFVIKSQKQKHDGINSFIHDNKKRRL